MKKSDNLLAAGQINPKHEWILYFFSLLFVFLTFLILYKVPFNGDDAINCLTGGSLGYNHRSVWDHTYTLFKNWVSTGRLYPLAFYSYALFAALPALSAYRTFLIVLNMLVIASFGILVRRLTGNAWAASAAVILVPVFIQFRYYQDPVLAYHGMLQFVALYLIWAMYLQIYGLQKKKVIPVIASGLLFACCILTYEISYSFIVIFIIIAMHFGKEKSCFFGMLPHLLVTAVILGITLFLREHALQAAYAGISISWDIPKILKAFASQISSAVPLSYWLLATPSFLYYHFSQFVHAVTAWDIFLTAIFGVLLLCIFFLMPRKKIPTSLFLYGLALWLLPASIISLSLRYQTELSPGVGYLPVYIQYFGGVMIAISVIQFIFNHIKKESAVRILAVIFTGCFCLGFLINNINNRQIKNMFADNNIQSVSTLAVKEGILGFVDENSSLLVTDGGYGMNSESTSFIYLYSGGLKIIPESLQNLVDENNTAVGTAGEEGKDVSGDMGSKSAAVLYPSGLYVFRSAGDPVLGFAETGKVVSIEYDTEAMTITQVYVSEITVCLFGSGGETFHLEQRQTDGSITAADISACSIFTNQGGSTNRILPAGDSESTIDIEKISAIREPDGFSRIFTLDRSKSCILTVKSNDAPFVFLATDFHMPV